MDAGLPKRKHVPRCFARLRGDLRRDRHAHPSSARDGIVAGQAQRAFGIVDNEKVATGINVLHVRIVAAPALNIAIDKLHRPCLVLRRRRVCT